MEQEVAQAPSQHPFGLSKVACECSLEGPSSLWAGSALQAGIWQRCLHKAPFSFLTRSFWNTPPVTTWKTVFSRDFCIDTAFFVGGLFLKLAVVMLRPLDGGQATD